MFQVQHAIIATDVATARFSCDLFRCKGGCCVVGTAGAPVEQHEIPVLRKAYQQLSQELRPRAREVVEREGVISYDGSQPELNCTDGKECVFVTYNEHGMAMCSIQKAWQEGRFDWIKPISCHLFPLRITRIGGRDYINFHYVPEICSPGCDKGACNQIYLSDFMEEALTRKYGHKWYEEFREACREVRATLGVNV